MSTFPHQHQQQEPKASWPDIAGIPEAPSQPQLLSSPVFNVERGYSSCPSCFDDSQKLRDAAAGDKAGAFWSWTASRCKQLLIKGTGQAFPVWVL